MLQILASNMHISRNSKATALHIFRGVSIKENRREDYKENLQPIKGIDRSFELRGESRLI
jgi:hypothetical protein